MGRRILMICTSGTSAVSGLKSVSALLSSHQPITDQQIKSAILEDPPENSRDYHERMSAIGLMKSQSLQTDLDFGASYKFPSAEVQTILRWLSEAKEIEELRIILLPSHDERSILTANVTVICLQTLQHLFPNTKFICSRDTSGIIPLPIEVDTREKFLSSIAKLFSEFDTLITDKHHDEEVIICSTGGFKAVSGFAMLYAQINSIPCLYSFETSPAAYEVMSMPLGYAYSSLDEEISMLKAVHRNTEIDKSALPQWVKDSELFTGTFLKSYEEAREKPYGTGEELFRRLRECDNGNEWADYLQELLVSQWSELWLGDQIPETVEHSRRHSKRLMELAANLFRCAGSKMAQIGFTGTDPRPLALLIASIYLHDIGHTALSYPVIVNDDDVEHDNLFPLGLFPSAIRELHHLLTGALLKANPSRYFMNDKHPEKAKLLAECVPLIAAHHRGYTALKGERAQLDSENRILKAGNLLLGAEKFNDTLRPLEERAEGINMPVDILLNVTALLRVLDGCDVQSDRVISKHYINYRNQRNNDEARLIHAELLSCIRQLPSSLQKEAEYLCSRNDIAEIEIKECCSRVYSKVFDTLHDLKEQYRTWRNVQNEALPGFMALSMLNRLAFKLEQRIHFNKHKCVGFVLPVMNTSSDVINIKIFPNYEVIAENSDTISGIIRDINGEYQAVKDVLCDFPAFEAVY